MYAVRIIPPPLRRPESAPPAVRWVPVPAPASLLNIPIVKKCGAGAFGDVYESGTRMALKIICVSPDNRNKALALATEAKALKRCKQLHVPHVIRFKGYGQGWSLGLNAKGLLTGVHEVPSGQRPADPCDVLAVELASGGSLDHYLKRGPLVERSCKQIARQILEALVVLHRDAQIIHRDIKPGNIVIDSGEFKLIDFGLCADNRVPETPLGTLAYMAPEVLGASAFQPYNSKADLWSLGITLYECVSGHPPFNGQNMPILKQQIQTYLSGRNRLPYPPHVSSECAQFISSLIAQEAFRPDAQKALFHPWLSC